MQTAYENEIKERVIEVVKRNSMFNAENVSESSNIRRDHGIDSIKMVELVVDLEDEFDIEVDSCSLSFENFSTVELIIRYVIGKAGNGGEA
ncbi:acyl carrier protein [Anaerobacterium chartisolvens]|uniref:Acyl carrier protein n=1 Tax=Anaerobacterium chartisolvens TaxID=1297424 RepID=A0A369ATK0_9FIRM|nr:acyl carrier protein [Anaerobacterium chartisolvens]RCX12551.1 acyl carrier protein [Anaerobacterium chartisolvens]